MSDPADQFTEQATAFQKVWTESLSKLMQTAFTVSPGSPPPEVMKQIRSGLFEALAKSWEEFMRSPQFLESMRQWMENAVAFRRMNNDLLAKMRNELQAPSREDMDSIMLSVRHMETRILDRVEELSAQVHALKNGATKPAKSHSGPASRGAKARARKKARRPS
jgi:hypothetical protein